MQDSIDPSALTQNIPPHQPQSVMGTVAVPQSTQNITQEVFDQSQQNRPLAAMNAIVSQVSVNDPLNPANPTPSSAKEQAPLNIEISGEMPSGMQSVEQLRTPEISPEVEKYIEEVREEPSSFPHEVVLADQKLVQPAGGFIAQPVIVLPMTQEEFEEAKKASPDTAKRWLAEFTERVKKMFSGSVMFREEAVLQEKVA